MEIISHVVETDTFLHTEIQYIEALLKIFKIKAKCINYQKMDNYFFFDLVLLSNTKVKDLNKYLDEISLALKTSGKPLIRILHEEGLVRLEFVSPQINLLKLFNYFHSPPSGELMCLLGKDIDGKPVWMDLIKNPHMIVAGTTGSGKSTLLHNIIANLLIHENVSLCLLDPKNIEFANYSNIHNICIGYSYTDAIVVLDSLLSSMEYRYELLRSGISINNLPYGILIIDEFADLIMQDENNQFYDKLCKLAQKCRAAKMSIILSTQRPSCNVINGTIKANFPARIACRTASNVDSRIILDANGAENLFGKGDALLKDNFNYLKRFQIAHTDSEEVCKYFRN